MTCTRLALDDGTVAIVCHRREPARPCAFCGAPTRTLCDFPLRGKRAGATCNKRVCEKCATVIGKDRDLCPPHARMAREYGLDLALLAAEQGDAGAQVALDQLEERGAPVSPKARAEAMRPMKFRQRAGPDRAIVSAAEDWREYLVERAAIGEYLGELTREEAERQARELAGPQPRG